MTNDKALEAAAGWRKFACRAPKFERARRITRHAIEKGIIKKPLHCEKCGIAPAPGKDGRSMLQCHHPNYDTPLVVEWLCSRCHRAVTPVPKTGGPRMPGTKNPNAKLTEDVVRTARARHQAGESARSLAREFGVSKTTMSHALYGGGWKHVG